MDVAFGEDVARQVASHHKLFAECVCDRCGRGEDYPGAVMRFLHELDLGEDALRPLGLAGADTRNVSLSS